MIDPMLLKPEVSRYRFALYCCGHRMDLTFTPQPPVALYSDEGAARAHGARLWPTTFSVIDLEEVERS